MAQNYKLCPKCNNALDNDVEKCCFCGYFFVLQNENQGLKEKTLTQKISGILGKLFVIIFCLGALVFMIFIYRLKQEMSDPRNSPYFQVENLDE